MDANNSEMKPATWADITDAVENKNTTQLKECLRRYPGEHGNYAGLAPLCEKSSKISSELKVLLMAKLVSRSLKDEYLEILNNDFNASDIKKVIEALLEQLAEKFDFTDYFDLVKKITKSTTYNKIKDVLAEFPTIYETCEKPTEFLVSDACRKTYEIPSELKVLLMAKLILRTQNEYHLEVLNSHFKRGDIKKVLQQLDEVTLQKLDSALKGTACHKVKAVLEQIMNKKPKAFSKAAAVDAIGTPVQTQPAPVYVKTHYQQPRTFHRAGGGTHF